MALYHTHRPQTFDTVIGQEPIIQTIKNQILTNKIAHAYLFSGPRGIGKTTTARVLAKAVNCPKRKPVLAEACNECDVCKDITTGRSIDVIEIDAASHTGVDSVRENIIDNVQFRPTKLPYKVFIIDEVHMLSASAFNALLKTLEEPPAYIIFILATTELHKLPATIVSRCQRFHFKKVPHDAMREHILSVAKQEGVTADTDVVDRIINKSDGCVRDAISLLEQIMATGEKHITANTASLILPTTNVEDVLLFLEACVQHNATQALKTIQKTAEEGVHVSQFGHDFLELLRHILLIKAGAPTQESGLDISEGVQKKIQELCKQIDAPSLVRLTDLALKRRMDIKSSPLPQLPLELLAIEWCEQKREDNQLPGPDDQQHTKIHPETGPQNFTPLKSERTERAFDSDSVSPLAGGSSTKIHVNLPPLIHKDQKAEKKSIVQKVKEVISPELTHTVEQVQLHWQTCKDTISRTSPSFAFILNSAHVHEVSGNTITVSVGYSFHKDKLDASACKKEMESHLSALLSISVQLKFLVITQEESSQKNQELQELASAFGGEILQ